MHNFRRNFKAGTRNGHSGHRNGLGRRRAQCLSGRRIRPRHHLHRRPHLPQRLRADRTGRRHVLLAHGSRPLPPRRGTRLPVGTPRRHHPSTHGARGHALARSSQPDTRRALLDLRSGSRRGRSGTRYEAPSGGLLQPLPQLPARHHSAGHRGGIHEARGDELVQHDRP